MIAQFENNRENVEKMRTESKLPLASQFISFMNRYLLLTVAVAVILAALSAQTVYAGPDAQEWEVVMEESKLGFKNQYAGIEFDGRFKDFEARIFFDPARPEAGHFDVAIDVTSVTTFNAERDYAIGDPDWFHFSKFPKSTYVTKSIKATGGNGYVAVGTLDLKGIQKDVELRFTWDEYPNGDVKVEGQAQMLAEADILRTDFKIGAGTWEKDDTVAFEVLVKIDLLLKKK